MSADATLPDDALLERVASELRRPVALSSQLEERVMGLIERERAARPPRTAGRPRLPAARIWWAGAAAVVALAAGVTLRAVRRSPPVPGSPLSSTAARPVQFRLVSPASSRVAVVGDFNDWDPKASPLVRGSDRGTWSLRIALPPGRYRYTFLVDGTRWVPDPAEPPAVGDDFDTPTSVITVAGGST